MTGGVFRLRVARHPIDFQILPVPPTHRVVANVVTKTTDQQHRLSSLRLFPDCPCLTDYVSRALLHFVRDTIVSLENGFLRPNPILDVMTVFTTTPLV